MARVWISDRLTDPRIQAAMGTMGKDDKKMAAVAAQLSRQFHLLCGRGGPRLSCYTLEHAISRARYTTQRDSEHERLVGLYLHHQDAPHVNTFCSEVLGDERVAAFLNDNFVLWGWDLKEHIASRSILQEIKKFLYLPQVRKIMNLEPKQLPMLITIVPTPLDWEILSIIQGSSSSSVDDVMTALQMTRALHAAKTSITRQANEEEDDVQEIIRMRNLVMLRGVQTSKVRDEYSWSLPLSLHYELSLLATAKDIIKQEEEEEARKNAWEKAITAAIREGKDIATIHEKVTAENADPMTRVMIHDFFPQSCCLMGLAAWEGRADVVTLLHAVGVSVEGADTTVVNPLLAAAIRGHAEVVVVLLSLGADCLARDDRGNTALHLAAHHGHQQCVALLAAATPVHESVTDHNGCTPVHAAAVKGHWVVVQQLSAAGWSLHTLDNQGNTLLHSAARGGSLRLVEGLVAAGLSPNLRNSSGHTPLVITVQQGNHTLEAWFLKRQPARRSQHLATPTAVLCLMRAQMDQDRTTYSEYMSAIKVTSGQERLRSLLEVSDPHLVDDEGRTALHVLAQGNYFNLPSAMLHCLGHHHVRTRTGLTPLDLARRSPFKDHALRMVLESHQCPRVSGSPEDLYLRLLTLITTGDDARAASTLLCAGAPMELNGDFPSSALQQAVTSDRPRIVTLLLASGATLTASARGLNLLQQAWHSPNTTAKVFAAITQAFSQQLQWERKRLPRGGGLRDDLARLIATVKGDTPWEARWPEESRAKAKIEQRSTAKLTAFMVTAAQANCPLTVAFLRWAGAWPFFSRQRGTTVLHAALTAGHLHLVEVLVRDLGASLYIPDSSGCQPSHMHQMPPHLFTRLQMVMYRKERARLEVLAIQKGRQEQVEAVLALQEALFLQHTGHHVKAGMSSRPAASRDALLLACRVGLLQLLHLLLSVAQLPPDTVVDEVCGTTGLHEAAAHGRSGCVAHLLSALQAAAAANAGNVAAIAAAAAAAGTTHTMRLDRYSPLQPDRYGQTALHLAAMFGHKDTLELLRQSVGQDPPCRAGTTAGEVHHNFTAYLRRYRRYNDAERKASSPIDKRDAAATMRRLLQAVDIARLPGNAQRANVDFSEGEAARVRAAVLRAAGVLLGRCMADTTYMAGRQVWLRLVGSSRDGSKMFCPDEFDINVVVAAAADGSVVAGVQEAPHSMHASHTLTIDVATQDPHLQGHRLAQDLHCAVRDTLTAQVLDDGRLSMVPPGLTLTQVGVALTLAWQGHEYPLLLVGVDLVPVVEVAWHGAIARPGLTPPGATTMHLSATAEGTWRCSFAQVEAEVLAGLCPEERAVQLSAKLLLASLKVERWMPRRIKDATMWFSGRPWTVPVPSSFCLKTALFRVLEQRRGAGTPWVEGDTIQGVSQVFEVMCMPGGVGDPGGLLPRRMKAYFGGDCEATKDATGAPAIVGHLRGFLQRRHPGSLSLHGLACWWRRQWWQRWHREFWLQRLVMQAAEGLVLQPGTKWFLAQLAPDSTALLPLLLATAEGQANWKETVVLAALCLLLLI
ncbi:hypothetical protein O3P69_009307 [Scylla paramamosain]|uniref:UAS domain-containing protein n=1 Tax=Scylla paramamosain TaxID=85552 RepID=A0AAW0TAN9_SCYPA